MAYLKAPSWFSCTTVRSWMRCASSSRVCRAFRKWSGWRQRSEQGHLWRGKRFDFFCKPIVFRDLSADSRCAFSLRYLYPFSLSMSDPKSLYSEYVLQTQKAADLYNASAVLQWDQETHMPPKGAEARGRQLATLASTAHSWLTSDEYGGLLKELSGTNGLG